MYEGYFGLTERPFSIAPDPQYLYMSRRHKEAMAHLSYGLSQGGCFIVLTGEVGTGKTTLCRNLLSDLPDNVDVALILNANINEAELLQTVCDELKIGYQDSSSQKQLLDKINEHLLNTFAENRHTVLIIDEAQLLSRDVLEQIRLLTNLETTKSKLLQIILIGQPELNDLLLRNDLRQLAQRVTARYHLAALERNEIEEYVNYRLGVAGCKQALFSRQALNKMHALTSGIPRKINVLADHALLSAYAQTQSVVDAKTVKKAAKDVFIKADRPGRPSISWDSRWWWVIAGFLGLNLLLWGVSYHSSNSVNQTQDLEQSRELEPPADSVSESDSSGGEALDVDKSNLQLDRSEQRQVGSASSAGVIISDNSKLPSPGSVVIAEEPLELDDELVSEVAPVLNQASVPIESSEHNESSSPVNSKLETSADLTGRIATFRRLAKQWGVQLPDKLLQSACAALSAEGLQCLGVETWQQALAYNRPTIMVLRHEGQLHRVILQEVMGDVASIQIGDAIEDISVSELNQAWTKNALIFWRPGSIGAEFVQLDDRSENLPKVRKHLNKALAKSQLPLLRSVESSIFDLDLSQKVFALQSKLGIAADSQIGNQTYLLLNEIVYPENTPTLLSRGR